MKLISLNLEGKRHLDAALPFLEDEAPDVIGLLEAPIDTQDWLSERGYTCTYLPQILCERNGERYQEGVILASQVPHTAETHYYYQPPHREIVTFDSDDMRDTTSHGVIFGRVGPLDLAVTHFTWNSAGETANKHQTEDLQALLAYLNEKPAHVLCGDFNIPRRENELYDVLIKHYTDAVPDHYVSSLDRTRHRAGPKPELQKLFDRFMVDYLFTQPPYEASDVRLVFGVSDHAAVVGTIHTPS